MVCDMGNFDATSTARDVIAGVDLHGKHAIVTGGSSGIGAETARVLASAGATVTLAVRNREAGERVRSAINSEFPAAEIAVAELDLSNLESVRAFVAYWSGPLHLLVNNAGVMAVAELTRTVDGHEMQFATNHLGHFALAVGLHSALAAADGARIVSLSSRGHLVSNVDFDDPDFDHRPYHPFLAYGQSKTANVLFAVEAARRWADDGITANAVHPGAIGETNLYRHMPAARDAVSAALMKTTAQGAATSVYVATAAELQAVTGRYFEDCREARVLGPEVENLLASEDGVAWYALDPANATRLWDISERLAF
jgi:NAD(P)-dependent dehydrogenase (short-subunit alcohol dehydrogenase family)